MKGSLQITGCVKNAVPLHDIPRTGRRDSDLVFLAVLQEYLQFPYFLSVLLLFRGYCCELYPSNNPRRKIHKG
jgi:hypothetical protein